MKLLRYILTILIFLFYFNSFSQDTESAIKDIREKFKTINQINSYQEIVLNNEEFLEHMTDGGGHLTGFCRNDTVYKIYTKIGLSFGVHTIEYYYWNEKPIFIYFIEDTYEQKIDSVHGFLGFNIDKFEKRFEARYYLQNDSLLEIKKKGESLYKDREIKMKEYLLERAERYLKIVKNKAK
ncbi:MAG TPA: hypothetical protein DCG75_17170 [Bacteroidales bacterium]|nr:hypothetical protein [Bacteroidales bacterium]